MPDPKGPMFHSTPSNLTTYSALLAAIFTLLQRLLMVLRIDSL